MAEPVERKLAWVTRVDKVSPILGADRVELATLPGGGWNVVVLKDQIRAGELMVYVAIDSVLPESEEAFAFLEGKRVKTKEYGFKDPEGNRYPPIYSQGVLFPLEVVRAYGLKPEECVEDQNLTSVLPVTKYVFEGEEYSGILLPASVRKTGENRVQECYAILRSLVGKKVVITLKLHGTSTSYVAEKGEYKVCGHRVVLEESDPNSKFYYEVSKKHKLEEKVLALGENVAVQGELCGPKINKNTLKLKEREIFSFYHWLIDEQRKDTYDGFLARCAKLEIPTAPLVYRGIFKEEWADAKVLLDWASTLNYPCGAPAEGMVVMTDNQPGEPHHSFKVISNKFLAKVKA